MENRDIQLIELASYTRFLVLFSITYWILSILF